MRFRSKFLWLLTCCALAALPAGSQTTSKVTLNTSETIFSLVTTLNACGYDQDLNASEPVRAQVRAEVARAVQNSPRAHTVLSEVCTFVRDHKQGDAGRDLAQYISLALNLGEPPAFANTVPEADLPPDAAYVLGFVPLVRRFYIATDLHEVWKHHAADYSAMVDRFHKPVASMMLATDVYLKMPVSSYLGRRFVIYLEPMAGPGQVNARNYGDEYFMVLSPEGGELRMTPIRHTYLHYVIDPLMTKRRTTFKRLEPLMDSVKLAPMDEAFKNDTGLMITESLIRAVEARTQVTGKNKEAEAQRDRLAEQAAAEGFVLAPSFERKLAEFEKQPEGLRDAIGGWLYDINVPDEQRKARDIVFARTAGAEAMHASPPRPPSLLDQAEKRLAAGEIKRAQELAQQALEQKREPADRALFILARVATLNKDMAGAKSYFEQALAAGKDPQVVAWSHIYLGRICDLKAEREAALEHYRAALKAGDDSPATRAAAERGLQQPYAPPTQNEN